MLSVIDELLTYINMRRYHWILLEIEVERAKVCIYDPLGKPIEKLIELQLMLQR
jgi:hypothetical protein